MADLINKDLNNYRHNGFNNIHGWCNHQLFELIDFLNNLDINKDGGCLEIGIHHGKFFLLLNSIIDSKYTSYAIDIFDQQNLNIDRSGEGNLDIFKQNLINYDKYAGNNTKIIQMDSTDKLASKELCQTIDKIRFISIDGGHTVEHTISDLQFANTIISNTGIVILDDILDIGWLGVIHGAFIFLSNKPTLVPFAIGYNKLFLCKLSYRSFYFDMLKRFPLCQGIVDFFGYPVIRL